MTVLDTLTRLILTFPILSVFVTVIGLQVSLPSAALHTISSLAAHGSEHLSYVLGLTKLRMTKVDKFPLSLPMFSGFSESERCNHKFMELSPDFSHNLVRNH